VRTSKRRCARLRKALCLQGARRRHGKPRTTDSRHGQAPAPNRLAQLSPPSGPYQVWVTDLTYLETGEGGLYLAAILDVWSRRIVGWACAPTLDADLVVCALQRALKRRRPSRGLLPWHLPGLKGSGCPILQSASCYSSHSVFLSKPLQFECKKLTFGPPITD
jgi:transposase InsO family protein